VPTIVVSEQGKEQTRVEALESGVDDYVTGPFGTDELLAQMRTILRRSGGASNRSFSIGKSHLDVDAHRGYARVSEARLTPKEFGRPHIQPEAASIEHARLSGLGGIASSLSGFGKVDGGSLAGNDSAIVSSRAASRIVRSCSGVWLCRSGSGK
jgi:hypothetical protein